MQKARQLLVLEMNEVNFEFIDAYISQGKLPAFRSFFSIHGYQETTSEASYEQLEPWIQWITAHTGMPLAEHGVFRLGDIVHHDYCQIWERLEEQGIRVGAVSPMNANCRARQPAFFIPDPWTATDIVAPGVVQRLFRAIVQAVSDNAEGRLSLRSLIDLTIGGVYAASSRNYVRYLRYLVSARRRPWKRALFLDLLLADVFATCLKNTEPGFATLFLNAAAHIQHHYMFSASAYSGPLRNPAWYVEPGQDPLLDVYELYDHILGSIRAASPHARVMIVTALHQDPHDRITYYWRLRDHKAFLQLLEVPFRSVEPRMSRDFVVFCADSDEAAAAARRLESARSSDGELLFEVDNRGDSLFVMLTYSRDIDDHLGVMIGGASFGALRPHVAFVAIKNGQHNGVGYFSDSGEIASKNINRFALAELSGRMMEAIHGVSATDQPSPRVGELRTSSISSDLMKG